MSPYIPDSTQSYEPSKETVGKVGYSNAGVITGDVLFTSYVQ